MSAPYLSNCGVYDPLTKASVLQSIKVLEDNIEIKRYARNVCI